jgi:signal transduction histidine kinase
LASGLRRAPIVTLVLVLATLPLAGLAWATWQLLAQGHVLEQQQRQDRLTRAADRVVAALQTAISASERALSAGAASWPPGAVAVTLRNGSITAVPAGRLAFVPLPEPLPSDTPDARTAALLPRGQKLSMSGQREAALRVFEQLREAPAFLIEDTPSWVAARYMRGVNLERAGRKAELRDEGVRLGEDLRALAPHLTGAVYRTYAEDAERWAGAALPQAPVALGLALDALWQRWSKHGFDAGTSGRDLLGAAEGGAIVLWKASPDGLRALIATPSFVDNEWLSGARDVARQHNVSMSVEPHAARPPGSVTRTALDAGLPWRVTVAHRSSAGDTVFRQRRALIISSFLTLVVVVAAASYVATRSISRELAVSRQQSNFVAAVSHEFRTPLTSLRQFVELLREQPGLDDARRRECYDAQARSVDRLSRLVESLLDFGKLETGAHHYRLTRHDCAGLARTVVADFNEHAANAGYRIEMVGAESAAVNVDAEAVSRALWNLLDNAVKYSPGQTRIEVGVRTAPGAVCIDVRDRGIGIGRHESRVIFRRFHRGAEARSRGIRGTGLGLAMVAEIMQAHGGRVDLQSQPGQGSIFTLVFPAAA